MFLGTIRNTRIILPLTWWLICTLRSPPIRQTLYYIICSSRVKRWKFFRFFLLLTSNVRPGIAVFIICSKATTLYTHTHIYILYNSVGRRWYIFILNIVVILWLREWSFACIVLLYKE